MEEILKQKLDTACWIARQLFEHRMGPGTTGNLSFIHNEKMYITASGTCFGRLFPEDFSEVDLRTRECTGKKPSKELPLHQIVYDTYSNAGAVIHVHSTNAVLWSLLDHPKENDCIPAYTPYLKMKLGSVGLIPYAKPGSEELFSYFRTRVSKSDGWLLKNHGPVVKGKDLMDAFACIEELEDACTIAWHTKDLHLTEITEEK